MPERRAVFLACNAPFVGYAAACVHSVLTASPGWSVHVFATNVPPDALACYPFDHHRVTVHAEARTFADLESERCYMNSRRFARYRDALSSVDLAVYLDADAIVICPLDRVAADIGDADIGLVLRPYETAPERQLRACTVATRSTPAALAFWDDYAAALPPQTWYADQLALDAARRATAARIAPLPEPVYSSFVATPEARVLVTCTDDKLGFPLARDYASRYAMHQAEIETKRAANGNAVALVWVVFGADGARLDAIRFGIRETLRTLNRPGTILLIEATGVPILDRLAETEGLWYRHICPGPRSAGVWQKEALWEVARKTLAGLPSIRYAVFLDADCVPRARNYFAQVQRLHDCGIVAAQPYRRCSDTVHADIGGESCCWHGVQGRTPNQRGAQSGFCWSFDLRWLAEVGGFPNVEPLGGGDTLLCHMIFSPLIGWFHGADHMRQMSDARRIERQPYAALPVDLVHHSHGPRGNRQYDLRYRVARATIRDIMAMHRVGPGGLLAVVDGPVGDAWLRMLARRSEWSYDMASIAALWSECLQQENQ